MNVIQDMDTTQMDINEILLNVWAHEWNLGKSCQLMHAKNNFPLFEMCKKLKPN